MNLHRLLQNRASEGKPLRVALIGAGKFGSMFLAQARRTPGLHVVAVSDLVPQRARDSLARTGWDAARYGARSLDEASRKGTTCVTGDAARAIASGAVEIAIDATGDPAAGIRHAHTCELVDWTRAAGFEVVAAGKGTQYLPAYHESTPETVWRHYGFTPEQIARGGFNARMFNSFLDGTKSAIEMAAVAKRDLGSGETLDGEGGYTVWGRLMPARDALARGGLPIGLAHGARLARAVGKGAIVTWADVVVEDSEIVRVRREMEALFAAEPGTPSPGRGLPG
ncbi:MAG: SAF domain-containing protein [Burkholderiales bacterium]